MKAVLIVHNVAIDEEINETLKSVGIHSYTKFPHTLGKGKISEPHLDSDVWPGINCGTFIVTDETKAKKAMENIRQMREKLGTEGVKAFMWEIDDIT